MKFDEDEEVQDLPPSSHSTWSCAFIPHEQLALVADRLVGLLHYEKSLHECSDKLQLLVHAVVLRCSAGSGELPAETVFLLQLFNLRQMPVECACSEAQFTLQTADLWIRRSDEIGR